ncbi:hypothetical protein [Rhodanobacter thiooxydans]|uniref:hypothetical protein n=1 Tax=Rhodanobacter thiooxydans TaxID=416169 RepID=UPI00137A30D6|nr:hypothetical protein [Rhodanobacter thiooxydans]
MLGFADMQFQWSEEEALDPTSQQTILTSYQKQGVYSINDVRAKLGEDPISEPGANAYLIFTGTGAMPLEQVMEPPQPPSSLVPNDPNAPKPDDEPPKPGETVSKHAHDHLHKAFEPLTSDEVKVRDAFATALEVVRDAAMKQASKLGKVAPAGGDGGRNYTPDEITTIADEFATLLDTSGLSLAFEDYSDTIQAVTESGAKHEVAKLIVTDPDIATTEADAVAAIFGGKDPDAVKWAVEHAAEMLGKDGAGGALEQTTRNMVREAIAKAMQDDDSLTGIADMLQNTYAFSPERAELIARFEVGNAQMKGGYAGALAVGMKAKKWLESNDENECPRCHANAEQGWIPIDQDFQSGDAAPLAHPRCQCDAAYRRKLPEN